jgi:Transposase IS116/IS110/IS902 family
MIRCGLYFLPRRNFHDRRKNCCCATSSVENIVTDGSFQTDIESQRRAFFLAGEDHPERHLACTERAQLNIIRLAPFAEDSANRSGRSTTAGGRAKLHQTLYVAVQTAYRSNPRLQQLAPIACLNKMIKILTSILTDKIQFMPHVPAA